MSGHRSGVPSGSSKRRLVNGSPSSQSMKKSRREPLCDQPLNLQDALSDEFNSSVSNDGKKSPEKTCSLCGSSKHLLRVEEGVHFRVNQAIDVELYLNSLLYKDEKRSVPKPILLCPLCYAIVKKYIDQKSRIASLEASKGLDDPVIAEKLKKLSEVSTMWKALNTEVVVRVKKLEGSVVQKHLPSSFKEASKMNKAYKQLFSETVKLKSDIQGFTSDLESQKKRNLDLEAQCEKLRLQSEKYKSKVEEMTNVKRNSLVSTVKTPSQSKGTNTVSIQEGHTVETYEVLLLERDKDMAQLDRVLKSTVKVKDMAIDAQNLLKFKNGQLESKIKCLEKVAQLTEKERSMIDMVSKITDNMDTLKMENESLNTANSKLTSELKEMKEQMNSCLKDASASREQNVKLSQELLDARESIQRKDSDIAKKCIEIQSLSQEIALAKKEIETQTQSISVPLKDLEVLKEDIAKKESSIKHLNQKLSEKDSELTSKAKQLIKYKLDKSKFEKQIQEFEKLLGGTCELSNKKVSERLQELQQTISRLKSNLGSKTKELESRDIDNAETLSLLNSELQDLKKELSLKTKKIEDLDASSCRLQASFEKNEEEKKILVEALVKGLGKDNGRVESTPASKDTPPPGINFASEVFNSINAKYCFGEGIGQLTERQLDKSLFFVNTLVRRTTQGNLRNGSSFDEGHLKKIFDEKLENFSKTLKAEGFESALIYTLFTEAFLFSFGKLPAGVSRRKLGPNDKLLTSLPSITEASEIMANTPILIDILDTPSAPTATTSGTSTSSSLLPVPTPPQRPFLKVRTNLLATTASMTMSSNTISQPNISLLTSRTNPPPITRFVFHPRRPQILVNPVNPLFGNQLPAKNIS